MILVDTSVWINHFRHPDPVLFALLDAEKIVTHPFVLGELSMGSQPKRSTLKSLFQLDHSIMATDAEVLHFVAKHKLNGVGIGYLDAHLLASAQMTPETLFWTSDKRLAFAAATLSLDYATLVN
jgi:predicted nucleic acid-binding protein